MLLNLAATHEAPERSAVQRLLDDPVKAARHEELGGLEMQRGVEWLAVVRAVEDELTRRRSGVRPGLGRGLRVVLAAALAGLGSAVDQ